MEKSGDLVLFPLPRRLLRNPELAPSETLRILGTQIRQINEAINSMRRMRGLVKEAYEAELRRLSTEL